MNTVKLAISVPTGEGGTTFNSDQLSAIGAAAVEGTLIEMTPFKQFYVTVDEIHIDAVTRALNAAGLFVLPAGYFTKNLQACNFCKGENDAGLGLAQKLEKAISGLPVPIPMKIGYAGCALGTSEPLTKEISVVKMKDGYDIFVGGDVKGIKPVFAVILIKSVPEDEVITLVQKLIAFYNANAKGKEKFRKFINRITLERIKEVVLE